MTITTPTVLDVQLMHPIYLSCLGILILILFVFIIIFFIKIKKGKEEKKIKTVIILCVLLVLSISAEAIIYLHYQYNLNYDILEYSVVLESQSNEFEMVVIPISQNSDLQKSTRISSGNGILKIIDTEHGKALQVNFTNKVKISGDINTISGVGIHDLSMKNNSDPWRIGNYWINYSPYNTTTYNCSFNIELYHESLDWWEWQTCEGFLIPGWNMYRGWGEAYS